MQQQYSIEVGPKVPGETPIRRSILAPDELMTVPAQGVETLFDILRYSASLYQDRRAFGYRKLEKEFKQEKQIVKVVNGVEKKETKTWSYFQLSPYHYYTYAEAFTLTQTLGSGLKKLGLKPGDKMEIFASTSVEWMLMAHGAFSQAVTIVTAYDTLGPDGLKHSLNESGASLCFINGDQLPILDNILTDCPHVRHIIYRGEPAKDALENLKNRVDTLISFDDLRRLGEEHKDATPTRPKSEDIACIMYTSGSTGDPKGVILTHGNVVAAIAGVCRMLQHLVEAEDSMMAYLPLAHVLEFLVENLCIFLGLTLGYGTIRTLTDASVRNCHGDIRAFSPSIMTGVPQVWETIRKTVLGKVVERGPRIEKIFFGAIEFKSMLQNWGLPTGVLDKVVFKDVKKQLGGRLRYALSGGAPLSSETQRFLSLAACPILGGYGMTESMCSVMAPEQFAYGEVGAPVPCVEVKLVDVPEAGYLCTNEPRAQGEIWIRGPSITSGYFKREDETREALTEDGWLRTGDIGEWTERGTLRVIDRKKNLVKLSNGEYIALEKLESIYKTSVVVENMCVYADSLYPKPVALVVPIEAQLRQMVAERHPDLKDKDWEALCEDKAARVLVLQVLQAQAKKGGLKGTEIIQDVWLCKDLWTSEMGLLTAAQKLKRRDIHTYYATQLKAMIEKC
ncbi:long-chain fatty acid-CoA ligase [Apophysomyces ossiformis]|uniref:Long-chain fatty acid-CoA ligase n=1 Tax=Apophysomyces ossiformis TaxID=679940 RepID=A0A8H7ERD4_9FUNG|nr:long-chain fatty acid-CoA ligase [Apophysomyces ossiformis]